MNHIIPSNSIAAAYDRTVLRNKLELLCNEQAEESNSDDLERTALQTCRIFISVNHYNNLKRHPERVERRNIFLWSRWELRKSEFPRLKKALSNTIVCNECECACSSDRKIPSTFAPRKRVFMNKNYSTQKWQRSRSIEERYAKNGDSIWTGNQNFLLPCNCIPYSSLHVFKICPAKWSAISCITRCSPNEVTSEKEIVKNWKGQWFEKISFNHFHDFPTDSVAEIEAPFLSCQNFEFHSVDFAYSGNLA